MKRPIFVALILLVCGESAALERNSYIGVDGKLVKSNAKAFGVQYKHNRYGIRPFVGFKIMDDFSLEAAHEWTRPGIFRRMKEGVNVSSSATSALISATLERDFMVFPEAKWFLSGGVAHTKIKTCESSQNKNVLGHGKAARAVPTAKLGLRKDFGEGLNVRGYLDWKGTGGMKIKHAQHPNEMHTFRHTFGLGIGVFQEF